MCQRSSLVAYPMSATIFRRLVPTQQRRGFNRIARLRSKSSRPSSIERGALLDFEHWLIFARARTT